ncbi:hypothetical protein LOTGIDRAFT_134557 [Lottia gigantea]|uniref:GIPC GH2 domain-containing protein n=1 Tax=Lottia gigantea TaxID=225164 RepID=V4B2C2_LOTGI|nr:hypothetical protein LOTGIDRAFT_134557 [Lottia gigantea]ESO82464.1 hypothetical protein LOTGIDRAFT_134557 [Lottia gigantea]
MDELQKLEYLSLVSKVCTELENHLGINDKDLAEYVIDLAEKNSTFDTFKKALDERDAEFSDSLVANLLRLINKMKPKPRKSDENEKSFEETEKELDTEDVKLKRKMFPGLALPNNPEVRVKKMKPKDEKIADDMMGELEALMTQAKQSSGKKYAIVVIFFDA